MLFVRLIANKSLRRAGTNQARVRVRVRVLFLRVRVLFLHVRVCAKGKMIRVRVVCPHVRCRRGSCPYRGHVMFAYLNYSLMLDRAEDVSTSIASAPLTLLFAEVGAEPGVVAAPPTAAPPAATAATAATAFLPDDSLAPALALPPSASKLGLVDVVAAPGVGFAGPDFATPSLLAAAAAVDVGALSTAATPAPVVAEAEAEAAVAPNIVLLVDAAVPPPSVTALSDAALRN